MFIIEKYLSYLYENDMSDKIANNEVITYISPEDIKTGLLRFNTPPEKGKCFLFILPLEDITSFHTIGMKFNIDIFFYDYDGKLVVSYLNVKPGVRNINSVKKVKYIIEIPTSIL